MPGVPQPVRKYKKQTVNSTWIPGARRPLGANCAKIMILTSSGSSGGSRFSQSQGLGGGDPVKRGLYTGERCKPIFLPGPANICLKMKN